VKNKINNFLTQSDDKNITVIVVHDREGTRDMESPFNADLLKETFKAKKGIADVYEIVATQDIESWFFHDIEGIYEFLRVPKNCHTWQTHPKSFSWEEKDFHCHK
jgi:hypothetical protein